MEALEVRHLGGVARFGERFEASANECGDATAQHGLLAYQVGFGFFGEGGLDDGLTDAANGIGEGLARRLATQREVIVDAADGVL
jgi:hypothetical protein|tara:strand:+ start:7464 stop:7718 length:255 start_codon:yes stop_codon:yes gene_type:complete